MGVPGVVVKIIMSRGKVPRFAEVGHSRPEAEIGRKGGSFELC